MSRLALVVGLFVSACYVAPTTPPPGSPRPGAPQQPCTDIDGDGYCVDIDCNDQNNSVYPNAPDAPGDGIDQNCDGYP